MSDLNLVAVNNVGTEVAVVDRTCRNVHLSILAIREDKSKGVLTHIALYLCYVGAVNTCRLLGGVAKKTADKRAACKAYHKCYY